MQGLTLNCLSPAEAGFVSSGAAGRWPKGQHYPNCTARDAGLKASTTRALHCLRVTLA